MAVIEQMKMSDEYLEQFYAYGFAQYGTGNWTEAADVFRVLCTRRPLEERFWFALGASLQQARSYSDALHAWSMAALLSPENPLPHFHAAECCFSLQNKDDGAKALKEAEQRLKNPDPLQGKIAILKEQWRV